MIMGADVNILSLIPQRAPFVMVDSLSYNDDTLTRTTFTIKDDNILVEDARFTEAGLVENIAQTSAAGAGYKCMHENSLPKVGYIGSVKNLEIYALPLVNDELVTETVLENQVFNVTIVKGKIWCKNVLIARCEMKIFITP